MSVLEKQLEKLTCKSGGALIEIVNPVKQFKMIKIDLNGRYQDIKLISTNTIAIFLGRDAFGDYQFLIDEERCKLFISSDLHYSTYIKVLHYL